MPTNPNANANANPRRQLEASNATLNFVLGGRTKSWMESVPQSPASAASTAPQQEKARPSNAMKRPVGRPRKSSLANADFSPANERSGQSVFATNATAARNTADTAAERAHDHPVRQASPPPPTSNTTVPQPAEDTSHGVSPTSSVAVTSDESAPLTRSISGTPFGAHVSSTVGYTHQDPIRQNHGCEDTDVRPQLGERHTARINKSPTASEIEAQAMIDSNTSRNRGRPQNDEINSLNSSQVSDARTASLASEPQRATQTSTLINTTSSEAQVAAMPTNPELTTGLPPASMPSTNTTASPNVNRRRPHSVGDTGPLSPSKLRCIDTESQEYRRTVKCQTCRRAERECDGNMPCLGCRLLGSTCHYANSSPAEPSTTPSIRESLPVSSAQRNPPAHTVPEVVPRQAQAQAPGNSSASGLNMPPTSRPAPQLNCFEPNRCLTFLNQVLYPYGSAAAPRETNSTEFARLSTLREAAQNNDVTFLLIHQLYCLAMWDPQRLPDSLRDREDVNRTFAVLDILLRSNNELTPPILGFCATFPAPFPEIIRATPEVFLIRREQFDSFFQKASSSWADFSNGITQRDYPPMVHELHVTLGVASPTLQRLIFLVLLRHMWRAGNSHWITQADHLFRLNQADWHRLLVKDARCLLRQDEVDKYTIWFTTRYAILRQLQADFPNCDPSQIDLPNNSPLQDMKNSPINTLLESLSQRGASSERRATEPILATSRSGLPTAPTSARSIMPRQPQSHQQVQVSQGPRHNPVQPQYVRQSLPVLHQYPAGRLLPPPATLAPQQVAPNPNIVALHQAHMRGPLLQLVDLPKDARSKDIFQHVTSFELPPFQFKQDDSFSMSLHFVISEEKFQRTAKDITNDTLKCDIRSLRPITLQYRIRGCHLPGKSLPIEQWSTTETSWHTNTYLMFNGRHLETQRKLHNGKDLPIDITSLIRPGENNLEIYANVLDADTTPYDHVYAVEVISLSSASHIRNHITTAARIPPSTSLQNIRNHISGTATDDMQVLTPTLTIPLSTLR